MPSRRTSPIVTTRLPASTASLCIAALLAKLASPTWAMFAPGSPSSSSARTGLPLLRPSAVSRMSKCASSVISPISSSAPPIPSTAGRVIALLPPTNKVSACASHALAHRGGERGRRLLDGQTRNIDIAPIRDLGLKFAPRFHIIAADPLQRRAEQRRRLVARPRGHRTGGERRAEQPDRRAPSRATISSARLGQLPIALTVTLAVRLRRFRHVGPPPDRLQRRDDGTPGGRSPGRHRPTPRSASRTARSSASASAPSWPASAPRKSCRSTAPG